MDKPIKDFLVGALGTEGAKALKKAAQREPILSEVLIPRAILGWLSFSAENQYEGSIPGQPNSYVSFSKSDSGYSGSITIKDGVYSFQESSVYQLAATIALSLGLEPESLDSDIRDAVLVKLGKSIDTLCKAQVLIGEMKKKSSQLIKVDLPGTTAKPQKQLAPIEAEPPKKQPANAAAIKPKIPPLAVAKAEAAKPCKMCGKSQFKENKYSGCLCLKDLAKSIHTTTYSDGYVLTFSPDVDQDSVRVLIKMFRSGNGR
jgi:hypothetical protein